MLAITGTVPLRSEILVGWIAECRWTSLIATRNTTALRQTMTAASCSMALRMSDGTTASDSHGKSRLPLLPMICKSGSIMVCFAALVRDSNLACVVRKVAAVRERLRCDVMYMRSFVRACVSCRNGLYRLRIYRPVRLQGLESAYIWPHVL